MPAGTRQQLSFSPIHVWYSIPDSIRPAVSQKISKPTQEVEHGEPEYLPGEFCLPCSQLTLSGLLENVSISKPKRRAVGSIAQCESAKGHCQFCRFLIQACELAYPRETNEAFWNDDSRKRVIYLANDPEQRPWYRAVAIDLKLPTIPYTWLQVGTPRVQRDHWVCVNVVPSVTHTFAKENLVPRLRKQDDEPEEELDYELVKTWLRVCRERHGQSCSKSTILERRFLKLYVIDVQTRSTKPQDTTTSTSP